MDIVKPSSEISIDMETFAVACEYMDNHATPLSAETLETSFNMIVSAVMLWDSLSVRDDNPMRFTNESDDELDKAVKQVMSNPKLKFVEDFITGRLCDMKAYEKDDLSYLGLNYLSNPLTTTKSNIQLDSKGFDRRTALYPAEKHLSDFYDELDAKFGKTRTFKFPTPLLHDFIKENANTPQERLEVALELRKQQNVTEFRKTLDLMDKLLNEGRLAELDRVMKTLHELCREIVRSKTRKGGIGKIKVKWTFPFKFEPSKEFEVGVPTILRSKFDRNLHLTFLADLLDFGLNRRSPRL